jgi:choline dehydrogenase-like flavoprotein
MAYDISIDFDVAIVGSGFAGAVIAYELAKKNKKVVILEAGAGIPSDINKYMQRFYTSRAKVPESPYTPALFAENDQLQDPKSQLQDPKDLSAGRPTVLTLSAQKWKDEHQSYLIQKGPQPFASTYDRVAGGTSHWLGTCLRFVPSDFQMQTLYGESVKEFVNWPIKYDDLNDAYGKAEKELGVSADVTDQAYLGIHFPDKYSYPMPRIPESRTDTLIRDALSNLSPNETSFLGMKDPITRIGIRALPAARNSQPYGNRRACAGNTNCIPICPIQAKYDPTITLNDALNTGFVTFMDRTVASEIIVDTARQSDGTQNVTKIKFIKYDNSDTGKRIATGTVTAKIFVIAANAIETPRLLLMSKNEGRTVNGVANSSDKVGRNLMDHPYYVAWGLLPQTDDLRKRAFPYRGPLITSGIEDLCDGPFRSKRGAFRVDIGNEGWNFVVAGGQFGADPAITTIDFVNGMNGSGLNKAQPGEALLGVDLAKRLNDLISRQFRIGFLVEQTPDPENRVTLSDAKDGLDLFRPAITYKLSGYTRQGIVAAYRMKNLLFQKLGADDFTMVQGDDPARFEEQIDGNPVALTYTGAGHIMGTYRMGTDPKSSVVDDFQRAHDHKNLFLVGSGVFPTGATANPTLTIVALCLRTAEHILTEDFKMPK